MNKNIKQITIIGVVVALIAALLIVSSFTGFLTLKEDSSQDLEEVSLRLTVPFQDGFFAQFYVAQDKGFYAEEGLNVTFNLASEELNPVKMVATGADNFGLLGGPETLLIAKSRNQPLKAISLIHKESNFPVILTLKSSGITSIEELEGKKIGVSHGVVVTDLIKYVLNKEGINYQEISAGSNYNLLISGQVDAMWAFRTTAGFNLPHNGVEVNVLSFQDYDVVTHGYTLFTHDRTIETNPELVERFLRATFKGIEYTKNNPEEAVDIFLKRAPEMDRELELKKIKESSKYTKNTKDSPLGYMDDEIFKEIYDRLNTQGLLENQFEVSEMYTTRFLGN